MRIGLWGLALATTSACARVFGIDELPAPATITIDPLRRFAHDDASGHGVVETIPATVADTEVAIVVAGVAVAPTWSANGTFSFVAPRRAAFTVVVDRVELQDVGTGEPRTITLDFPTLGRPDAAPVSAATALVFPATPLQSLDDRLYVTGAWEAVAIAGDVTDTATASFATGVARLLGGVPALPDLARGDGLLVVAYTVVADVLEVTSTIATTATPVQPVSPTDGAVTIEATTTASVALDRCARFAPVVPTELARFAALANAAEFPIEDGELAVLATPSAMLSDRVGFPLVRQTTTRAATFALPYGDPFGRDVLAIAHAARSRSDQPGGDGASYAALAPTGCGAPIDFGAPVAIAAVPTLAGTGLDVGERALALADTATLAWELAAPGRVDAYEVAIVSLDTGFEVVRTYVTRARSLAIDPTLFAPNSRYAISITTLAGLPDIATDDYATRAYPTARAVTWSSPFTVH